MVRLAKVDYDKEYDILYASVGRKVRDSLPIDKFVIDFAEGNDIVGIEILDASKIISDLSQNKLSKEQLGRIEYAKIKIVRSKELVFIVVLLLGKKDKANEEIKLSISAPIKAVSM